jgi:hypothetical protein
MEEPEDNQRDAQREVDERIDELAREGEEMEDRLEQAGSDAEDVDVPDADDAAGGGMQVSELVGDSDEDKSEDASREG